MPDGRGGARAGAGRKPKAEKYETEINVAERRIADKLPAIIGKLEELAMGGAVVVKRKLAPAILVTTRESGRDSNGNPISIEVRAFPAETNPKKMVVVEETREALAPDRAAITYAIDRILGRTTAVVDAAVTTDLGGDALSLLRGILRGDDEGASAGEEAVGLGAS
jgi:hypothetical protein